MAVGTYVMRTTHGQLVQVIIRPDGSTMAEGITNMVTGHYKDFAGFKLYNLGTLQWIAAGEQSKAYIQQHLKALASQ